MRLNRGYLQEGYYKDAGGSITKSVRFRVWLFFLGFTVIILVLMWLLQIFFVNNYYQRMKIVETEKIVEQINMAYKTEGMAGAVNAVSAVGQDDVFIRVEKYGKKHLISSKRIYDFKGEMKELKRELANLPPKEKEISLILTGKISKRESWAYARYLNKKEGLVLFIISPLYPVASTMNILRSQLIYICLIALTLAFALSFYLSNKITLPIRRINYVARDLAQGKYGITFPTKSSYAEINDLANTLTYVSKELEKTSNLQRDIIANVSHDLKTPLTMVKSYAEMIRDLSGDNPEKRNEHLQVIIDESDRLNLLVKEILTLTAVQSGNLVLNKHNFSIRDAFESILNSYRIKEAEGYQIQFNCRQDVMAYADEDRIKQVISNFVSNAIKYCGEDKKIYVNVKWWGKKIHCEFVDHGVGIKKEELNKIWDRHYKSSSNHVRSTKGSGIGLSIVKEILNAHKARFGVESKEGRGTTFWFELDVAKDEEMTNNRWFMRS